MNREEKNRKNREYYHRTYATIKGTAQHELRKKKQRETVRQHRVKNADKINARRRALANANPIKTRERRYKLKVVRPAPELCEACGTPFRVTHHGPCLDHNHKTNVHRGWLCYHCNTALGYAKDSRDRLQFLINYLDRAELLS